MLCTTTSDAATKETAAVATNDTTVTLASAQKIGEYAANLSAKLSTPGGESAAAAGATVGSEAASMAASCTTRKRDDEYSAAVVTESLMTYIDPHLLLNVSDDNAAAYKDI